MKKLIQLILMFLFFLGTSTETKASHMAGGEIWYEYIGNAQFPHRYKVFLQFYRDRSGIPACGNPCTKVICVTSTCFATQQLVANFVPVFDKTAPADTIAGSYPGSIITPELTDCVDSSSSALVFTEVYLFVATVDLPGTCADFKFSFSESARNGNNNLTTAGRFYIASDLNNVLGNNSSPKFINPAAKSFCINTPFIWSQAAIEPDGDSLYYDFGIPHTNNTQCAIGTPMNFNPGWSKTGPMRTVAGITIDHKNGVFRFTPSNQEVDVINVTVTEYRWIATLQQYLIIGTSVRDLQVPIIAQCRTATSNGPQFATDLYASKCINKDSIKGFGFAKISNPDSTLDPTNPGKHCYELPVIAYYCFDNSINIKFKDGVYCETISADGSEFRLIGPDSVARPITGVIDNCRPDLVTKDIDLLLHKPLDINGDYFLQIKTGNDGNTLTNKCGFPLDPFFMVIIRVNNCPIPDYSLENVSVNLDREIDINWEIDINSFEPSVFTAWNILRANSNGQFYILQSLNEPGDVNLRSFKDTTVTPEDVDLTQFQYMVQLVQNGRALPPSNIIHSILLEGKEKSTKEGVDYSWSAYNGWNNPSYEFEYGRFNIATNQMDWANFNGPNPAYQNEEYIYPSCEENKDTTGLYGFRVLATNPSTPISGYISESNWLYYEITCPQDPQRGELTVIVPTVFTPNGDGNNDLFKLTTNFENADVAIFNRWGKLVFETSGNPQVIAWDGMDKETGKLVADGVYYYVVGLSGKIDDGQGGMEKVADEKTGSLTIFSNGTK